MVTTLESAHVWVWLINSSWREEATRIWSASSSRNGPDLLLNLQPSVNAPDIANKFASTSSLALDNGLSKSRKSMALWASNLIASHVNLMRVIDDDSIKTRLIASRGTRGERWAALRVDCDDKNAKNFFSIVRRWREGEKGGKNSNYHKKVRQ